MNCATFRTELAACASAAVGGALPPDLERHALACPPCAVRVRERASIDRALAALPRARVPADFVERTVARALAGDRGRAAFVRRRRAGVVVLAAAACLVAAAGAWFAMQRESEPDPALLAHIELLADWDLLQAHGEDLELVQAAEAVALLADLEDLHAGGEPR